MPSMRKSEGPIRAARLISSFYKFIQPQTSDWLATSLADRKPWTISFLKCARHDFAHEAWQRLAVERRQRHPAHAGRCERARRNIRRVDGKLQGKVREDMAHDAGLFSPGDLFWRFLRRKKWRAFERFAFGEILRPLRRRHLGHGAEQAL